MRKIVAALTEWAPDLAPLAGAVWPWVKWTLLACTLCLGVFQLYGRGRGWDGRLGAAHSRATAFLEEQDDQARHVFIWIGPFLPLALLGFLPAAVHRTYPVATRILPALVVLALIVLAQRWRLRLERARQLRANEADASSLERSADPAS